jgi:hypothetical protein
MNYDDYLDYIIQVPPIYEAEDRFFSPFYEFMDSFQALDRYWKFSRSNIEILTTNFKRPDLDEDPEGNAGFEEFMGVDEDRFIEYLRLSVVTFSLSLLEHLLSNLTQEIAVDLKVELNISDKRMPFINKYILWLTQNCGLQVSIDSEIWKKMDAIREVRNRFIHKINRDLPDEIKSILAKFEGMQSNEKLNVTDGFVDESLNNISTLVKNIERAYIIFYDQKSDGVQSN